MPSARLTAAPTPEALGAGLGEATRKIGLAVYEQALYEADQVAFLEADRKASEAQTALQIKVRELKGKDAAGAPDIAQQEWDRTTATIEKGLNTDRQRVAFARAKNSRWESINRSTQIHVAEQREVMADGEATALLQAELDNARLNAGDPEAVLSAHERQQAVLVDQARRKGIQLDSPIFMEKQLAVSSKLNTEVVKGLLYRDQDMAAKRYYDENKELFTAADRDVVERALQEGSSRGEAFRLVNNLLKIGPTTIPGATKLTREEALQYVQDKVDNPKVADYARTRINDHFNAQEHIDTRRRQETFQNAVNVVEKSPGRDPALLIAVPDWATLSLSERTALKAYSAGLVPGDPPNNDARWLVFNDLTAEQVAALPIEKYINEFWKHFDNAHRTRADAHRRASMDARKKESPTTETISFKGQFDNAMRLSGLFPAGKEKGQLNDEQATRYVRVEQQAAVAVERFEQINKRKATVKEMQDIIKGTVDQAVQDVFVPGAGFFGGAVKKKIADLTEDQRGQAIVPIDKIAPDEVVKLRKYFQSRGRLVTPSKLERAYAQVLLGNKAAFDKIVEE